VRKICKTLEVDFAPNAVVYGCTVKSNDGASREKWTLLRAANGSLRDVTHARRARRAPSAELSATLVQAITAAAKEGRPFTKTGVNGLFERRTELGEDFVEMGKHQIVKLAEDLLQAGSIVAALASGSTTVKWLDVPVGPFATGQGEFAAGASTARGGRKGAGNAR
jgi:hypothetical protein